MDARFIFSMKQPCKNRGIDLVDNGDGTILLNGNRFDTMREAEDYAMQFERKDITNFLQS